MGVFCATEIFCFPCTTASQKAECPATFVASLLLTDLKLGLKWVVHKSRSSGKVLNKMRFGTVYIIRDAVS